MPDNKFHNVASWGDEEQELASIQRKFVDYYPEKGEVIDLGSGRGVFLELLKESGRKAVGVEMDSTMLKVSKERGHQVHEGEATSFLQNTTGKYDGIMASHIIEHMEISQGLKFIELIKKRLKKGGVAIIITPRPGSLWSTENFWLDTTHVRPYPYELMKRLLLPLEEVVGGIEPDSYVLKNAGKKAKLIAGIRKKIIGPELFDFAYGGGVWYIVVRNNA